MSRVYCNSVNAMWYKVSASEFDRVMQGRSPSPGAKNREQSSQLQEVLMRGVVHGEACKFTLARNGVAFKLKGFEPSIQLLVCMTLLGFAF